MEHHDAHADLSTHRLSQLVNQKTRLVTELHRVLTKQREMIDAEEVDLLSLLAIKQRLLEALTLVDRQMDPFRAQDPDRRDWPTVEERHRCRDEAEQCEALFREVKSMEDYCMKKMQELQDRTQEQLQGVNSARQAAQAYQRGYDALSIPRNSLDLSSED